MPSRLEPICSHMLHEPGPPLKRPVAPPDLRMKDRHLDKAEAEFRAGQETLLPGHRHDDRQGGLTMAPSITNSNSSGGQ